MFFPLQLMRLADMMSERADNHSKLGLLFIPEPVSDQLIAIDVLTE